MADVTASAKPAAGIAGVARYFGTKGESGGFANLTAFRKDWDLLTPEDKAQIRDGIANGTETY